MERDLEEEARRTEESLAAQRAAMAAERAEVSALLARDRTAYADALRADREAAAAAAAAVERSHSDERQTMRAELARALVVPQRGAQRGLHQRGGANSDSGGVDARSGPQVLQPVSAAERASAWHAELSGYKYG